MGENIKQEMKEKPFTKKNGTELDYQICKNANQDLYGRMVILYAERWAEMMEQEMKNGMTVAEAAGKTRDMADTLNITGYMFGFALNVLGDFWEYGEELRQWYDQKNRFNMQNTFGSIEENDEIESPETTL